MDKQQIISFIEEQLAEGKISKGDLSSLAGASIDISPVKEGTPRNIINTFYGIGAIIVIIGVGILVAQHWDEIGFMGRILATLGISLVTYMAGLLLNKPQQKMVSQVMFTIAATLAPLGSYVLLKEAGITNFNFGVQTTTALILAAIFGTALFISKKNILVLITVAFASWAYYAIIMKALGSAFYDSDFLKWASMLLGAAYIFIAYGFKSVFQNIDENDTKDKRAVQNVLYGFGTLAVLGAGISIGGIFDLLFIAFIFGAFYGSVYLKSRAMLIFGALFLMAHIIKLTSKYFVDSTGWPLALIVIGFLVIGVGYMTFYLNKKFLSTK